MGYSCQKFKNIGGGGGGGGVIEFVLEIRCQKDHLKILKNRLLFLTIAIFAVCQKISGINKKNQIIYMI